MINSIFVLFLCALYLNLFLKFQYTSFIIIPIVLNFLGFIIGIMMFVFSYKTIKKQQKLSRICEQYEENNNRSIHNILTTISNFVLFAVSFLNLILISLILINNKSVLIALSYESISSIDKDDRAALTIFIIAIFSSIISILKLK